MARKAIVRFTMTGSSERIAGIALCLPERKRAAKECVPLKERLNWRLSKVSTDRMEKGGEKGEREGKY